VTGTDEYRQALEETADQETYLLEHSGLPGPRGNLELARAAAEVCPPADLRGWARLDADQAPTGVPEEFLAFCGVLALGRWLARGDRAALEALRGHASDPRWRIREAVAMGVQLWGEADFEAAAAAMGEWSHGSPLERRAAAAALCEPALLTTPERVGEALDVLAEATKGISGAPASERRSPELRALRKGLGYCWSVAVAAAPELGRPVFEDLVEQALATRDGDLGWIVRENLRKRRLERVDPAWVARLVERLAPG
jgi:hypothetical protein